MYVASKKGGNTQIAFWSFFSYINDCDKINLEDTITEKTYNTKNGIAPGSIGAFDIVVGMNDNNYEISYEVKVKKEENVPYNLYFYLDDENVKYSSLTDLISNNNFKGNLKDRNQIKYKINWKWPYETYEKGEEENSEKLNEIEFKNRMDLEDAKSNKSYIFELEVLGKQCVSHD